MLDVFRRHKDLKPEGIAELNEAGQKLARVLAEEVAAKLASNGRSPSCLNYWRGKSASCPVAVRSWLKALLPGWRRLKVLNELRPKDTVTICLPLFLAGGAGDRAFAKLHPTITVDGCDLRCAARATEKYSNKPAASLVVNEVVSEAGLEKPEGRRRLNAAGQEAVRLTAERIGCTGRPGLGKRKVSLRLKPGVPRPDRKESSERQPARAVRALRSPN